MGYKAIIREQQSMIEEMQKHIDILYAAIKTVVEEKGDTENGAWIVRIPDFDPNTVNANRSMVAEPKEGYITLRVTERESIS